MWYKRSTYRILNNMVSNLRQSGSARTLLMKWRSMAADKNEDSACDSKETTERVVTTAEADVVVNSEEHAPDVSVLQALLREKFGINDDLSFRQKQNQEKTNEYMNRQLTSLSFMHEGHEINVDQSTVATSMVLAQDIPQSSLQPYLCLTLKDWDTMAKRVLSNVEPAPLVENDTADELCKLDGAKVVGNANVPNDRLIPGKSVKIILSAAQIKIVAALKESIEGGQLLGYLQGFPGAGKTTTAQNLEEVTGLRVLYCGSTGTAAANFKSETVNSLLSLGLSVDYIDLAAAFTTAQTMAKIVQLMDYYHMLLIDEASMLTPVTLARIELRLRQCFHPDLPFGGKHILLLGDMWQFPPVSGLAKPALYQAAVIVATNKRVPNEAYRAGANLFTQFKLFVLKDQQRMDKDYAKYLKPLSDMKKDYPITDEWLSKLKVLIPEDLQKPDSPWTFATVAVTGNVERIAILRFKAILFGKKWCEPIVTWICKVKSGSVGRRTLYSPLNVDEECLPGKWSVSQQFFVRNAPCVITENLSTKQQLAKATKGVMVSLAWDPKDCEGPLPDLNALPKGEICLVAQPKYIIIRVEGKLIPIKYQKATLAKYGKRGRKKQLGKRKEEEGA